MLNILKKFGLFAFETIKVLVVSLAIILPIRYFLIQPFYVEGASMELNFQPREYLIIDEISYRLHSPQRGDVVVFRYPKDPRQFYIKRVIGLPGERVRVSDGIVYVNDTPLDEKYISVKFASDDTMQEKILQPGEFFMMGDNRSNSLDSRIFGPVDHQYLIGRVWIRGWPFNRVSVFGTPTYQ